MAKRPGDYTVYIFRNISNGEYLTVTKCPNWSDPEIDVGQEGYLTFKFVKAYEDTWVDGSTLSSIHYKYSANYYLSFLPSSHVIKDGSIVKKELYVK
jgi:hypothetical protein